MAGLVPAIHVFDVTAEKTWMPGPRFALGPGGGPTRVPGMTVWLGIGITWQRLNCEI